MITNSGTGEMIKQTFFDWIIQERDKRSWNDAELASAASISHSNLSMIMSGQRNITFDFCVGIARAFRVRPELVLYRSGLLAPPTVVTDDLTEDEEELIRLYRSLPPGEARSHALKFLRGWADQV